MRRSLLAVAATVTSLWPATLLAQGVDGSYGRVEGDLLFNGSLGVSVGEGGAGFDTHVGLLYLSTAGIYGRYAEAFGDEAAAFDRLFATGIELRPVFLGRYALDLERGPAHVDLFLDSFALLLGATFSDPIGPESTVVPGLEFGASIEFPILPSASGPYVGVLGLIRTTDDDLLGYRDADLIERGSSLVFTLSWHQIFDSGLVDLRDGARPD